MSPRSRFTLVVVFLAVILLALLVPPIAGAVCLNLANAAITHSLVLPADAPARNLGLRDANSYLQAPGPELPRASLARARVALGQGDATEAYRILNGESEPDPLSRFVRGGAAFQIGNQQAAIDDWRVAGAFTYFREQVVRELGAHDFPAAARDAEIAAAIDPGNSSAHLALAEALSRISPIPSRVSRELDLAVQLTRSGEERSTILSLQGEMLAREGNLELAQTRFSEATKVAPTDARPRTGLALLLLRKNPPQRDQAVAWLAQVTADSPWYTAAYGELSRIAEDDGDIPGAERWLIRGLEANRNNPFLLTTLGNLYMRHGQIETARTTFILALRFETHADELKLISEQLAELNAQ